MKKHPTCSSLSLLMVWLLSAATSSMLTTTTAFVVIRQQRTVPSTNTIVRKMGWLEDAEREWFNDDRLSREGEALPFISSSSSARSSTPASSSSFQRPICIQPVKLSSQQHCHNHALPLLPGETVYLHFNEDSEIKLFEMSMEHHDGKFAIGLINDIDDDDEINDDDGDKMPMLATMPILQIHRYNNMAKDGLGIFVTAAVIGKSQLQQVFSNHHVYDHPLLGMAQDDDDVFDLSQLDAANQVADGIELLLSSLSRYRKAKKEDDDDEEDDTIQSSLLDEFLEAYNIVYESDQQRYNIPLEQIKFGRRSWRELKALSWAASCVALNTKNQQQLYQEHQLQQQHLQERQQKQRLEILYSRNVLQRLQLARNLLSRNRIPTTATTTAATKDISR